MHEQRRQSASPCTTRRSKQGGQSSGTLDAAVLASVSPSLTRSVLKLAKNGVPDDARDAAECGDERGPQLLAGSSAGDGDLDVRSAACGPALIRSISDLKRLRELEEPAM